MYSMAAHTKNLQLFNLFNSVQYGGLGYSCDHEAIIRFNSVKLLS
jgi:hypothetical protein